MLKLRRNASPLCSPQKVSSSTSSARRRWKYSPITNHWRLYCRNPSTPAQSDSNECGFDFRNTVWTWSTNQDHRCISVTHYHEPHCQPLRQQERTKPPYSKYMSSRKSFNWKSPLRLWPPPHTDQGRNWSGHDIVSTNRNHKKGWPADKNDSPLNIREYWPYRDELATENGLAYRGTRLIIPTKLRPEMVVRAHRSHLGIQYTLNTAREIIFWPRMHAETTEAVGRCETCQLAQPQQQQQPLMSYPIPTHPWQLVASDCFEINGRHYVMLVDIYSDFIELSQLPDLSSNALMKAIKPVFATHGAPATLIP